ncbi:uncharacterized protein LOC144572818 [Carex rostrata]
MVVTGLYRLCANRASTHVELQRKPAEYKSTPLRSSAVEIGQTSAKNAPAGRKVMVVADSNKEAKAALQWCLSHVVQKNDTLVLLHVVKPYKLGEKFSKMFSPRRYKQLTAMKNTCQLRRPEIKVEILVVQGSERGPAVVEAAKKEEVSLLILGQPKRMMTWRLLAIWARNQVLSRSSVLVEYCIQNASCMTLGIRRKSRRSGGYLITTKTHKNFWLLA